MFIVSFSKGKSNFSKCSFGNVVGVSIVDFLMLPEQCKIGVSYTGIEGGIGFLGLKKL